MDGTQVHACLDRAKRGSQEKLGWGNRIGLISKSTDPLCYQRLTFSASVNSFYYFILD